MKNRHSVEQIICILGEIERVGLKISDACRPHGISEQTCYRWRKKYGGMEISEARRPKELETENSRLKKLVADQALDIQILKEVDSKKWQAPGRKKRPSRWSSACDCANVTVAAGPSG
jgi:putative transposase